MTLRSSGGRERNPVDLDGAVEDAVEDAVDARLTSAVEDALFSGFFDASLLFLLVG